MIPNPTNININPVWIYAAIENVFLVAIGFGLILWTDVQQDLVLKLIASLMLVATGTSVGAAVGVKSANE